MTKNKKSLLQQVMNQIQNLETLQKQIDTGEPVLIYFSGPNCSVCTVLKSKLQKAISENFDKIRIFEVKSELHKDITSHFSVFSIPTTLVFFDKKEFMRVGRNISISDFISAIKRVYNIFYDEE